MPTYIMLTTLTPEGVQTVKNNPSRIREVNKEIEQLGASVKAQWSTLGRFDFVNVIEAPDRPRWRPCRWRWGRGERGATRRSRRSRSTTSSPASEQSVKVLVVGSGGREHAIVRALARSPQRPEVLAVPGNPGIAAEARCVEIALEDHQALCDAARSEHVDLVVIGPEAPLVAGVADDLRECGIATFGPRAAAARLEGSK